MNEPLFHKRTLAALKNFLLKPSQGLIISGAAGSGKYFTANWIASQLDTRAVSIEPDDKKNQISIEQIRELYNLTRTGSPLFIILNDAETMSPPAQNAFLKLLEEPPKNTYFILTVSNIEKLLLTIRSRAQNIHIHQLEKSELIAALAKQYPDVNEKQIESLVITNDSQVGSIINLLDDADKLGLFNEQIGIHKQFYSASKYQRHVICQENNFELAWVKSLLGTLSIIIQSLLKSQSNDSATILRLSKQAEIIEVTSSSLFKYPGNPKIHLSKLIEYL